MSQVTPLSLADVFGKDVKKLVAEAVKGVAKKEGETKSFSLRPLRRVLWWLVGPKVNENIDELLGMPINDTLGRCYLKVQEIRDLFQKGTEKAKAVREAPPEQPYKFKFKRRHEIEWVFEQKVEADIEGERIIVLEFEFKLALEFHGVGLDLANDGCLHAIRPGNCDLKGDLKCYLTMQEWEVFPSLLPWVVVPKSERAPVPPEGIKHKQSFALPSWIPVTPIRILPAELMSEPVPTPDPNTNLSERARQGVVDGVGKLDDPPSSTATRSFDPQKD